jgi:trehalose-phosphatase
VAVDFDGTLAPLVADPATSRPLPAARDALHALAAVDGVRVALVSGRTLADLRRLGDPPPAAALVGSHGAELELPAAAGAPSGLVEPAELPGQARLVLAEVVDQVQAIVAAHPGTSVEVKPSAAVLHTRGADRAIAAAATAQALPDLPRWRACTRCTARRWSSSRSPTPARARRCCGCAACSGSPRPAGCSTWGTTSPTSGRSPSSTTTRGT